MKLCVPRGTPLTQLKTKGAGKASSTAPPEIAIVKLPKEIEVCQATPNNHHAMRNNTSGLPN
jgi:hypothetical protein